MMQKTSNKFVLTLPSKPQEIGKVDSFLQKVNLVAHLNDDKYNKLLVATTEAVNNSIIHGNKRNPKKKVIITCIIEDSILVVRIHDEGMGFDLSTLPDPLAEENIMLEHGRGVFLMRSLMESVEFECQNDGADVIMKITIG